MVSGAIIIIIINSSHGVVARFMLELDIQNGLSVVTAAAE